MFYTKKKIFDKLNSVIQLSKGLIHDTNVYDYMNLLGLILAVNMSKIVVLQNE